jgi:hypothetical protein
MAWIYRGLSLAAIALVLGLAAPSAWALSLSEKAALQAAMQRHIDRQSVNGGFLQFDLKTGKAYALHPISAHPLILRVGPHYVLCFDFRNDKGKTVQVDFYLAHKGQRYVVFYTAVGKRELLHRLMAAGRVVRTD